MKTAEIREEFLRFFEANDHVRVKSSSLIPAGDPTLLFTNAGMNQFKDLFLGRESRDYLRATSSQKCVRAGGKHNDLENVGRTARHHTFFEMLGNFSFGDYFKEDAIRFAWELVVEKLGLDRERLWFTVFEGDDEVGADDEAADLWVRAGAAPERVLRFGRKDNFWQMGDTGPCGPCSEIHYYRGEDMSKNTADLVNGEGDDTLEIWNLVFMQYDRDSEGRLTPLPAPSVDTGAGLERLASILQNKPSNYEIDLFDPIRERIAETGGHVYGESFTSERDTAVRVLCDHARAATFLLADGVIPSTEGRGYVLRRIIRRAIRFGRKLPNPVLLSSLVDPVIDAMGQAYPELIERRTVVLTTLKAEEERFGRTLSEGIERVGALFDDVRQRGERTLGGEEVFRLYDTYGIPLDLIRELGEEEGVTIDVEGFEQMMKAQRDRAKSASRFKAVDVEVFASIAEEVGGVRFVGYDDFIDVRSEVKAMVSDGRRSKELSTGSEGQLVIDPTPFYAESGGQIGDVGTIEWDGGRAEVLDTQKPVGDLAVSTIRVLDGKLSEGQQIRASVPLKVRLATTSNHTATHLLHKALKLVLGPTVQQAGSLVAPDRLRFDYTWSAPPSDDQLHEIENLVNDKIRENSEVTKRVMPMDDAKKAGAVAMFGEKYGEEVRVVSAGEFSMELCGGCHVDRTGDIGLFKIVSDRSLASGVRRMEAYTGAGALDYIRSLETSAKEVQSSLNLPFEEAPAAIESLQERQRILEKELKALRMKLAASGGSSAEKPEDKATDVDGVKVLTHRVDEMKGGDLRNLADTFRSRLGNGVVVLGSAHEGKATLLIAVTAELSDRLSARALIDRLAPIVDGRGGGKPDLAQAGGKAPEKIDEALSAAAGVVAELMGAPAAS